MDPLEHKAKKARYRARKLIAKAKSIEAKSQQLDKEIDTPLPTAQTSMSKTDVKASRTVRKRK